MTALQVVELPGDLPDSFFALPRAVMGDDPCWIPPVEAVVRAQCSEGNPWFAHGQACTWIVPGQARLSCFVESDRCLDGHRAGFVGHFCSAGEDAAEDTVFEAARDWASNRGVEQLYGPVDFSTHFDYRLLVGSSGRPRLPFLGEPYNPAWWVARWERQGFSVSRRYSSRYVGRSTALAYRDAGRPKLERLYADGYQFAPLTIDLWRARAAELQQAVDQIFRHNFAYTPLSVERLAAAGTEMFLRRSLSQASPIVWGPEGELAGFSLVFPHWGPLVAGPGGIPLDHLDTGRHLGLLVERGPLGLVVKTSGVTERHRAQGLFHAMTAWTLDATEGAGLVFDHAVAATMAEDNHSQQIFGGQADTLREYALYSRKERS